MRQLLTERQVAEILAVCDSWLQKGRVYGYGPAFIKLKHPKGAIRYRLSDLEEYLAANTVEPRVGANVS